MKLRRTKSVREFKKRRDQLEAQVPKETGPFTFRKHRIVAHGGQVYEKGSAGELHRLRGPEAAEAFEQRWREAIEQWMHEAVDDAAKVVAAVREVPEGYAAEMLQAALLRWTWEGFWEAHVAKNTVEDAKSAIYQTLARLCYEGLTITEIQPGEDGYETNRRSSTVADAPRATYPALHSNVAGPGRVLTEDMMRRAANLPEDRP